MAEDLLRLKRDSLFEAAFIYKDSYGAPVDLTGLVDDADFTVLYGSESLLVKSLTLGGVTADLDQGRFDLLILEDDIDTLTFQSADFRFRIHWIDKGWQTLGDGRVIFDD